ncbi:hypothetical protein CLU96_4018 [Chryseobacterium sp. 52]|nr:hypothetical protein CLU96_4018 [Chryseobacterium sp. 52]
MPSSDLPIKKNKCQYLRNTCFQNSNSFYPDYEILSAKKAYLFHCYFKLKYEETHYPFFYND